MGRRESRLIRERAGGIPERIAIGLGAPNRMPDLVESLGSEKGCPRAVLAFVDARTSRWKKGDHGDETDGEHGKCRKHLGERQASLLENGAHVHRLGIDRDPA